MRYNLTRAAARLAAENDLDLARVDELAIETLTPPSDAGFWDADLYVTHTLAFHTPAWGLTTDYVIGEANYRAALEDLQGRFPRDVEAATVGHWTYSSFSCIKVRVLTAGGNVAAAFVALSALALALEDYPILDEQLYIDLECEVWDAAVDEAIANLQRNLERDDLEPIGEVELAELPRIIGEKWQGYGESNWCNPEWVLEARVAYTAELAEAAGQVALI